jgi:uncharacterized protein (DUF4415 family)
MPPTTRRPKNPMDAAEAVFKRAAPPAPIERGKRQAIPATRELVTLKIDSDVLEHFQADGPGWQDRINAALRAAASMDAVDESGKRPEDLNATNDD